MKTQARRFRIFLLERNLFAITLLVFLLSLYLWRMYELQLTLATNEWVTGDWLINYSNGMVRRGFLGEFLRYLAGVTLEKPANLILNLKIQIYSITAVVFLYLAIVKRANVTEVLLLFSPWALMFSVHSMYGSGRKEIILIASFLLYICIKRQNDNSEFVLKRWGFWFLIFSLPIMSLSHEGLFFFFQFFFLYSYLSQKKLQKADILEFGLPYCTSLAIVLLMAGPFRGNEIYADKICQSVLDIGLNQNICSGAILALGGFSFEIHIGTWRTMAPAFFLTIPIILIYGVCVFDPSMRSRILGSSAISLVPTVPLYILGADWGRWIHISALLLFTSLLATRQKKIRTTAWVNAEC